MSTSERTVTIRLLTASDYPGMRMLWSACGSEVHPVYDSEDSVSKFLDRNGDFCFAAVDNGILVGFIMVGCDCRSARVYHLDVDSEYRRIGIASRLVSRSWDVLRKNGILKDDVVIFRDNPDSEFWESEGFPYDYDSISLSMLDDF